MMLCEERSTGGRPSVCAGADAPHSGYKCSENNNKKNSSKIVYSIFFGTT